MSKIIKPLIIVLFFIILSSTYCFADTISYTDLKTRKPLYYDINNYTELYSMMEDLNYDYEKALEEIDSLNKETNNMNNEYSSELDELCDELNIESDEDVLKSIKNVKAKTIQIKNDRNLYSTCSKFLIVIVLIMGVIIYKQYKSNH